MTPAITKIEFTAEPSTFEEEMGNIYLEAFSILVDRQRKYGPDNIRKAGQYGIITRLEDKIERVKQAMNGEIIRGQIVLYPDVQVSDEGADDGEFDLANYALIKIAHRRDQWANFPLAENTESPANAAITVTPEQLQQMHEDRENRCRRIGPSGYRCDRNAPHASKHFSRVSYGEWD